MFLRHMPAYEVCSEYVEHTQRKLMRDDTPYIKNRAVDLQWIADTRTEFVTATSKSIVAALNHGMKEHQKLLFSGGTQFEVMLNGEGCNQTQLLSCSKFQLRMNSTSACEIHSWPHLLATLTLTWSMEYQYKRVGMKRGGRRWKLGTS